MGSRTTSAAQQIENFLTASAHTQPMRMGNEHNQRSSPAALGHNDVRLNSSFDIQNRSLPWHTQPQMLDPYPFRLQTLHSQRPPSALALIKQPIARPLRKGLMHRSPRLQPFRIRLGDHSSNTILDPLLRSSCSMTTTESPILESQAAHALTTLRSYQDQAEPHVDTCTTSLLCQQQACSKNDCPSSTQVICAAEEIEARFCDGNCAGSLCTGVGCPYNVDPYGYHGFDHEDCSDFWSCQWACELETCNITSPYNDNNLYHVAHDQSNIHHFPEHLTASLQTFSPEMSKFGHPDHPDGKKMHCSIDEFAALMDADAADVNWHFQSCHGQPDTFGRHWKNCQITDTTNDSLDQHYHSKTRPYISHSSSDIRSSPSTDMSASSSPSRVQQHETNFNGYTCMWITDQVSRTICGFSCGHGNDMQTHIETTHINPQLSSVEPGRRKSLTKFPRSLSCRWKDCKHNLQKKTLRSTQALRQHVFTHSGCL